MLRLSHVDQLVLREVGLETRHLSLLSLPGLRHQHPRDTPLPKGTTPEGLILLLSHLRPVRSMLMIVQYKLKIWLMTPLIKDMIQSSLSTIVSQYKPIASKFKLESGAREDPLKNKIRLKLMRTLSLSREREPSPDLVDPSVGEDGELVFEEEDLGLDQGDSYLTQFMLTEEEQKDFDSFS